LEHTLLDRPNNNSKYSLKHQQGRDERQRNRGCLHALITPCEGPYNRIPEMVSYVPPVSIRFATPSIRLGPRSRCRDASRSFGHWAVAILDAWPSNAWSRGCCASGWCGALPGREVAVVLDGYNLGNLWRRPICLNLNRTRGAPLPRRASQASPQRAANEEE